MQLIEYLDLTIKHLEHWGRSKVVDVVFHNILGHNERNINNLIRTDWHRVHRHDKLIDELDKLVCRMPYFLGWLKEHSDQIAGLPVLLSGVPNAKVCIKCFETIKQEISDLVDKPTSSAKLVCYPGFPISPRNYENPAPGECMTELKKATPATISFANSQWDFNQILDLVQIAIIDLDGLPEQLIWNSFGTRKLIRRIHHIGVALPTIRPQEIGKHVKWLSEYRNREHERRLRLDWLGSNERFNYVIQLLHRFITTNP